MPLQPETLSFAALLEKVETDWSAAAVGAREKIANAETSLRRRQLEQWAIGYRLAEILWDDDDQWAFFIEDPIWNDRVVSLQRNDVLRHSLQYMGGQASGPIADRMSAVANGLEAAFRATPPITAAEIPDYIEESHGIEALIGAYRANKASATSQAKGAANRVEAAAVSDDNLELDDCSDPEPDQAESLNLPALPSTEAALPRQTSPGGHYPDGIEGWCRVEVLFRPQDFDAIMRLDYDKPLASEIKRIRNGESNRKRIEGKLV